MKKGVRARLFAVDFFLALDSSAVYISENTRTLCLNSVQKYGMFKPVPQKLIHTEKC